MIRSPLSPYQRDIWVAAAQFPENNQYTLFCYDRLVGEVDEEALHHALTLVARRTDAFGLRLGEEGGTPFQWLAEEPDIPITIVDFTHESEPDADVEAWLRNAFDFSYSLDGGPLADLVLLRATESVYVYVRAHHIVCDAWGLQNFMGQVRGEYLRLTGTAVADAPATSYVAVIEADGYTQSEQYQEDRAYFSAMLSGVEPALFNRKLPAGARATSRHAITLERSLLAAVRERGESPFLFISAAVALYLARVHRVDEVVLGIPVLNRSDRSTKAVVGHFANTLPLRIEVLPGQSVDEFIAKLRQETRELLRHQRIPLGDVARGSGLLFDTTLSYMRWPQAISIPRVTCETVAQTHAHDQDALAIWVSEFDDHSDVVLDFEYACDIFDEDFTIVAAAQHIETLLRALVADGERLAVDVDPLSAREYHDLVYARNTTDKPFPTDITLPELFAGQVARAPQQTVLIEPDGNRISAAELYRRATEVAIRLRGCGVVPDDRVAVLVERGSYLMPAILGIQLAGAAYVPIDPNYPLERIELLLEDCAARVALVVDLALPSAACPVLRMVDMPLAPGEPLLPVAGPNHLAYVIYTSGSTGTPKGVMVEHRSVVNRLHWMQREYPIDETDVLLQKTPISFDVSVWELFWWSFTGAKLSLLTPGAEKDPREVLHAIERDSVTVIHFVPSMLSVMLDLLETNAKAREQAVTLRRVFCSGEALAPTQVNRFKRIFGDTVALVNLYGPTEATVDVSDFACVGGPLLRVPIGKPIDNIQLHVLGKCFRPQPAGAPGELYIGGAGVARGYLNRPQLTQERFVPDPFKPGSRLYRTGDLARWLADGNLEYLGRADDQVKIRGNRVEPNEVRDHVERLPGVRCAAVVASSSATRGIFLVAYYVADAELDAVTLRAELASVIPEFMIPAFFVRLDQIPLTSNGKLDRKCLPLPQRDSMGVAPRTPAESLLAKVWGEVLGVSGVGVHDDFYSLGGDSILMLRIRAKAERNGLSFKLADLMRNPTVAGLAEHVVRPSLPQGIEPFELVCEVDRPKLEGLEDAFPVSRLSLGLLFHSSQRPESSIYHDVFRYRFELAWDASAFGRAVDTVVQRFPALRSSFDLIGCSEPMQCIHASTSSQMKIVDLRGLPDAQAQIDDHVHQRRFHRYALDQPSLYLFTGFVRERGLDLVFSFHHAILDGWSVGTMIAAWAAAYRGQVLAADTAPALATYVREERRALASRDTADYWAHLLNGKSMTRLDGFRAHERLLGEESVMGQWVALPGELLARAKTMVAQRAVPLKALLLAAHCLTLHVFSRSDTVVTGVVTHGRPDLADTDRMVGLFLNTVPVCSQTAGRSWFEVVDEILRQERDGHGHRRYPLSAIQQAQGDVLHTAFNYVNLHVLETLHELRDLEVWEETNFSLFISAIANPVGDGMYLRVDTDGHSITRAQADLVGATFVDVLRRVVDAPDDPVDFAFLAPPRGVTPLPEPLVGVVTLFERQVLAKPDNCAIAFNDEHWTYQKLDQVSHYVATRLRAAGAHPGAAIGVAMNRSPEMIAVIWGILRAGLVCVPLDVSYPAHRLALILETAQPYRVVAHPQHAGVAASAIVLQAEEVVAPISPESFAAPAMDDLAMLLFTSGSTGRPKGVELPHRMWANYTQWQLRVPSGSPGLSTLQFAPLSFDMSFQEIFSTLCGGGELRLVSNEERLDPAALLRLLERYQVQRALLPFVALQRLAEASNTLGLLPNALQVVVSSGEQLRITEDIRAFCRAMPGLLLENQYGPTETHQVTFHSLTGDPATFPALPPIGQPLDGVEIQLLDAGMRPVPVGVTGEIYVGGECLARGYHRAAQLTDERFVPHPWREGAKLYRTGDLGRVLDNGDVVWLGRADTQVKVRGFRIEPVEVELAIMRQAQHQSGLAGVAVVARDRDGTDAFLAAFLTGDPRRVDLVELKKALRAELPDFMIPSFFVWVDGFSLTPSGKRDDAALRAIPLAQEVLVEYEAPRDEYERTVAELLSELLDVPEVSIRDDFFELGGTSLTAMRLVLTLEKRFGIDIPIAALIESPTVAGLAGRLRERSAVMAFDPLVPIRASGSRTPLFLVHPLGGHVLCYLPLARALPADMPVYALQAAGSGQGSTPIESIEEMAAEYLAAVRRVQPQGPYVLAGWSFGGFVAYEMARQLRALDPQSVEQVIVLDSITIDRERFMGASDDALLQFFYWELVWFERSHEKVEPLPAELSLNEKLDHIVEGAISNGVLPAGTPRATVRRLYELFRANWRALMEYRPPVTDCDFALLRADGPLPASLKPMHDAAGTHYNEPSNGWRHWTTGNLTVIDVPGDHLLLMKEPYVVSVAAAITGLLTSSSHTDGNRP
ncbi:non-ribosomal peptide synthetase [Pseudomonas palleroniana]|uniref:Amino acid adenylation domain-containing protein n=1 Tax=Pseudomonas palleroniana TaxID=191390 RepID=A0A1H5P9H3_9PSED|nr:non-ribosomal peptide synthetase [Pseudomonas palleroniana]KAB0563526.1 amino acid adenylation domain-containing protein [Pseudomonas palleroniana]PTC26001.1 non-ribosomal peptide synthetase [Pseudomonas palleroniana]SEF09657.1 amino acid adenylation domain-containing protein [Pseudomonas palleroniana]